MSDGWQRGAACLGTDTDLFFPPSSEEVPPEVCAICRRCPVREPCLEYALANPDLHGIWAGTSRKQRQRVRRERWRQERLKRQQRRLRRSRAS